MLKAINKIPAGTFLVPLIVSMILFTFWPNLFHIGGLTESLLTSSGTGFISAVLSFSTGTRINIKVLKRLLKHQGVLLLTKVMIALILSFAFLAVFGTDGFLGVSSIAFVGAMFSLNPAVQVSILDNYGYKEDSAIMGLSAAVTLPILPLIVFMLFYSNASLTELNWMPIVSALLPFLIGITLGNLDPAIGKLFGPLVGALLPFFRLEFGSIDESKRCLICRLTRSATDTNIYSDHVISLSSRPFYIKKRRDFCSSNDDSCRHINCGCANDCRGFPSFTS